MSDIIAAVATGWQASAIGIIRMSGPGCIQLANEVFTPQYKNTVPTDRSLVIGHLHDRYGRVIDEVLLTVSHAPNSYTGEDTAEFQCHGSPAVLTAGLEALFAKGARQAGPGEFTKRAFLNGRLDLSQAEAVIDMIRAKTDKGFDVAYTSILPDEREMIKAELCKCSDELGIALVLTTGGTGFSPRDITPEAAMEVIERPTPGIPEAMRAESMRITPKGCLSRSVAGIRKRTLIITLPGSKKASQENILAVIDPVAHGLDMLYSEGSADCAK